MTKKQNTFMNWSLVLAGLVIAVLYSPVGSPDFYSTPVYSSVSRNITPVNGTIANASKMHVVSDNTQDELNIPELSSLTTLNPGIGNSGSKIYPSNEPFNRSTQFPSFHRSSLSSFRMEGSPFLADGRQHNSSVSSAITMTNGITSLSIRSEVSNDISKQNETYQNTTNDGNSDPGGAPNGDPIPAGEGWDLLVMFGVCYAIYIKGFKINSCKK